LEIDKNDSFLLSPRASAPAFVSYALFFFCRLERRQKKEACASVQERDKEKKRERGGRHPLTFDGVSELKKM